MSATSASESLRTRIPDTKWFTDNEFMWRTGASFVWLLLSLPVALMAFSTVAMVDVFHPFSWIEDCCGQIFCSDFWMAVVLYGTCLITVNLLTTKVYSVRDVVHRTRTAVILGLLHPYKLLHVVLSAVCGAVALCCCAVIINPAAKLTVESEKELDLYFLNEHLLFIVLYGAWLGLYEDIRFYIKKDWHFSFPTIQQKRFFQVKAAFLPSMKRAVVSTLKTCRWYYVLYFISGSIPRGVVATIIGASIDGDKTPMNSLYGLLDLSLLWFVFVSGSLVHFLWIFGRQLFIVFNTQPFRFPIESSFTQDKDQTLPVVIRNRTVPLLKYLALLDLCQLSQFDASRRKQIFSLSQPGGRPANWTDVSDECLSIIHFLSNELTAEISHQTRTRQPTVDPRMFGSVLGNGGAHKTRVDSPLQSDGRPGSSQTPQTKVTQRNWGGEAGIQLWSTPGAVEPSRPPGCPSVLSETPGKTPSATRLSGETGATRLVSRLRDEIEVFQWKLHQIPHNVACFLKERSIVGFLFDEIPESRTQALFVDCQLHIWAVEGLSRLVVASFTEDMFGVVQKTLPDILVALLELLQALDTYSKLLVTSTSKPAIQPRPPRPDGLRYHLRTALVSSIYRITSTFHGHLSGIQLPPEHSKRLQSFVEYKE